MATRDKFFNPFNPPSNWDVAYCLGVLARIAYNADWVYLNPWADAVGFPFRNIYTTPGRMCPNFVLVGNATQIVVAIPGTLDPTQMCANIGYSGQRENAAFGAGKLHSFFLWCAEGIADYVKNNVHDLGSNLELVFVGHSLGGAVAQLLADYVALNTGQQVKYCLSFNSPRVGDSQWARLSRAYRTHLYYNAHDMIVELPFNVSIDFEQVLVDGVPLNWYEHREGLFRVPSSSNILASWAAAIFGKLGVSTAGPAALTAESATMRAVMANLTRSCVALAASSYALPLPVWFAEHKMCSVLDNMLPRIERIGFPEKNEMRNLHDILKQNDSIFAAPVVAAQALRPRVSFAPGVNPGGGADADLPPLPPSPRMEVIESALDWVDWPADVAVPNLVQADAAAWRSLITAAQTAPYGNPLLVPSPVMVQNAPRTNWLFKGHDRRVLQLLRLAFNGVARRDAAAASSPPTSSLSTREYIFDPDDEELADAVDEIKARVEYLLSLEVSHNP